MWNYLEVRTGNPISEHIFLKPKGSIPRPSSLTPPCSQLQTAYVQFCVLKIPFWYCKCAARWERVAVWEQREAGLYLGWVWAAEQGQTGLGRLGRGPWAVCHCSGTCV